LKDKDFRELLQVAFYDVDFANEPGGGGGAGSNPPYGLADAALYALGMGPRALACSMFSTSLANI
jgi:hypothetical protein